MLIFTDHPPGDTGPCKSNIVISTDLLPESSTLDTYLDKQIKVLAEQMPAFQVLKKELLTICAQPAIQTDFQWITAGMTIFQRQIAFLLPDTAQPERTEIAVLAATSTPEIKNTVLATLKDIVDNMSLSAAA
jgi:hypothetical protein